MYNILKKTMVEMTWPQIKALAQKDALVLLPLGVIEEHSRHLPLGTDIYIATKEAEQIAEELTRLGMPCVIAPPFYWGLWKWSQRISQVPLICVLKPSSCL